MKDSAYALKNNKTSLLTWKLMQKKQKETIR
jgi:hypothetical protein